MGALRTRIFITCISIFFALSIIGCQTTPTGIREKQVDELDNLTGKNYDAYLTLLDDSFIYFSFTDNDTITFYRHYFKTSDDVEIGVISNYAFNIGFTAQIKNKIYFYITTAENLDAIFLYNEFENIIYSVNIDNNVLSVEYKETHCLPGAIICEGKNSIVTRQSTRSSDNILTTFIEIYDIKEDTVSPIAKSKDFILDDTSNIGSYLMNCCTYNGKIYALIDERYENGTTYPCIQVYDSSLNLLQIIAMNEVQEQIMSARVGNMEVYEDIIYMRNYFDESFIGVISENSIVPLIQEQSIGISKRNSESEPPIFFVRGTNKVMELDLDNKKLNQFETILPNSYIIKYLMSSGEDVLVTVFAHSETPTDRKDDKLYLLKRNDLKNSQFK